MNNKIIIYDFDGTITTLEVPKLKILEMCGYTNGLLDEKFILKRDSKIDNIYYSTYSTILDIMKENNIELTIHNLIQGYENVEYNDGVIDFLENMKKIGNKNYIVSSGMKEFIKKLLYQNILMRYMQLHLNMMVKIK